ncbi:hypothetical protein AMJ57_04100, partial [Parcubacteria bacterium SG8_24]
MDETKEKFEVTECSRCGGSAFEGLRACAACHGLGRGMIYGSLFLYWNRRVDGFSILLAKLRRLTDFIVNALAAVCAVGGLALLVWHINGVEPSEVLTLTFWKGPHYRLLGFWFGVICVSFLYYRRVIAIGRRSTVRQKVYGEMMEPLMPPPEPEFWKFIAKLPRGVRIEVSRTYVPEALQAIDQAYQLARKLEHGQLKPIHLFGTLLSTQKIAVVFGRLGLKFETFQDKYGRLLAGVSRDEVDTRMAPEVGRALLEAYVDAYEQKQPFVDVTELFLAVLRADPDLQELLYDHDVDLQKAENVVAWIRIQDQLRQRYRRFSAAARYKPKGTMNRAMTAVATPFLDRVSSNLTSLAVSGYLAPVVGRDKELEAVFRVIEGGNKSVVLVGHHGVGKSAIIEGIAQRMVEEDVPEILQDKRLVSLNLAQLISGATASEAQERLLTAMYEIARAGNIVLVVEDVSGMVGITSGTGESIDLSKVLADELARGYCFAITTADPSAYSGAIENSPLGQALIKVEVPEPEVNEAIRILEAKSGTIEYKNKVFFSYDAVDAAVSLTDRYMHERFLPEKAIEVAKEVATAVRNSRGQNAIIVGQDVAAVLAEKTHIPLEQLTEEESKKLLNLEEIMHRRVVGQEQAVKAVAAAMRRARAELRSEDRPIANFL